MRKIQKKIATLLLFSTLTLPINAIENNPFEDRFCSFRGYIPESTKTQKTWEDYKGNNPKLLYLCNKLNNKSKKEFNCNLYEKIEETNLQNYLNDKNELVIKNTNKLEEILNEEILEKQNNSLKIPIEDIITQITYNEKNIQEINYYLKINTKDKTTKKTPDLEIIKSYYLSLDYLKKTNILN